MENVNAAEAVQTSTADEVKTSVKSKAAMPSSKELLKAGAQFGHETKRWNPKMKKYIFGSKNNIHIIDIAKTEEGLKNATDFLKEASSKGKVLFIGTKNQAADIVKDEAIRAGGFFIDARWAGGLLTNFPVVKKSLLKLNTIEKQLDEGVEGRTKYEVSRMKKEWQRLSRLYSGIKLLVDKPTAAIIIDVNYEKAAVRECRKVHIPIVAIVDTNVDPDQVDYVIPANDDAINSIKLILANLADAVLEGNKGQGIKHDLKDYSKVEVKIVRSDEDIEKDEVAEVVEAEGSQPENSFKQQESSKESARKTSKTKVKGILERVKEEADKKKTTKPKKADKKPE